MADAASRRKRRQFAIPLTGGRAECSTVYFLAPDYQTPAGGNRVIYRHVDILNANGINASVLHHRAGFTYDWFEHQTEITSIFEATVRAGDIVVIPEVDCDFIPNLSVELRCVIFNQNSHLTWTRAADQAVRCYMLDPRLAGVVTVSAHNQAMLSYAFPGCSIRRVHVSIDPAMFNPGAGQRPRRIAYMPRRGRDDARQVFEILRGRGVLDGWEVVALDRLTHEQVAAALRTTRIFLAFTRQEGFGLPAAEAMACGNYTIGNDGFGGREFFCPEFSARIETGDILGFATAVEEAMVNDRADPHWCQERGKRASDYVLREYSPARESDDVVALYADFLKYDAGRKGLMVNDLVGRRAPTESAHSADAPQLIASSIKQN